MSKKIFDIVSEKDIEVDFFYTECKFYADHECPTYFLKGIQYNGGDTAIVKVLINESDIGAIKDLCNQADAFNHESRNNFKELLYNNGKENITQSQMEMEAGD